MARAAVIALAVIACARSAGPGRADPPGGHPGADDPAALVAAMHHYDELVRAMDSHALAGLFVTDGVIANAGQVIATGPAGIEAFLRSFDGKVRVEATGSTVEHARIEGDRGWIDGRYAQDARLVAEDRLLHVSGRFTGEWVRAGGAWRVRRLETTPDPPPPGP
jgi:ketosteroid isomerase-like protein